MGHWDDSSAGDLNRFFANTAFRLGGRGRRGSAALSGFLTGIDVTGPVTESTHHYADLAEREAAVFLPFGRDRKETSSDARG
jgi:hypothetical protein